MIPKVIHYCWFGNGNKSDLTLKCIESWKKYCPDYKIVEWTEKEIVIDSVAYMKEAYEAKAWGFVPDVARLQIIYKYGGIYLDTDVELIKPLDSLLDKKAFMGIEVDDYVNLGSGFGAESGNALIKKLMDEYSCLHYKNEDGTYNRMPSPQIQTRTLMKLGYVRENRKQIIMGAEIYPQEYFSPLEHNTGLGNITCNTYSIHHYDGSWFTDEEKMMHKKRLDIIGRYGRNKGEIVWKIYRAGYLTNKLGFGGMVKFIISKLK